MTPQVDWGALLPREVRTAAEPMVQRWLGVLPTWCHALAVHWEESPGEDDGATSATMESRPAYREAVLTIGGAWLRESAENRDRIIRHEFAHLATAGMDDVFTRLLKQVKKTNPALHADYEEQWRQALEGATCDIAQAYGAAADISA